LHGLGTVSPTKAAKMKSQLCFALLVATIVVHVGATPIESINALDEDAKLLTPELAGKYGYPVETHKVTTADGYILTLHRIPNGKNAAPAPPEGRPVAWLQHGLLSSSSDWLMNTREKAWGYRLADAGYDVWLGNARGNTYSKAHVSLDIKSDEFWDFSWHEMGQYDLPAVFDYVLNLTGKPDLYYTGHSMGTTMFFTCMSTRPEYNSKVRLMNAFAPVSFTEHMISPINLIAPFANSLEWILRTLGLNEFLPDSVLMDFLGATICDQNSPIKGLCANVLFILCGYNSAQLNATMMPIIMGHTPAGSSVRSLVHYAQGVNNGAFRQYNHGKEKNLERYGQEVPPDYDLSKVTAPVALYWGENDWLGVKADVSRLAELLPNLQRKYRIPDDHFNHMDFLFAIDSVTLIYETVENFMKLF
jgi:lysosomal acid lipase/cholesteryl ester hydrolase